MQLCNTFAYRNHTPAALYSVGSIDREVAHNEVHVCRNVDDMQKLKSYYDELGKASAMFFSWTFAHQPVLVQLNGDMPESKARQYEQVLQQLP